MSIRYSGRELFIDDVRHELEYPIADAREYPDRVIVLFDPDSSDEAYQRFHNLIALDRAGRHMWAAELPTNAPDDRYYKIASSDPLIAYSSRSYDCTIEQNTGQIHEKIFTK